MNLVNDVLFSIRLIRKTPAFSAVCLLVITVGLSVCLCLYSLTKNTYYQDLPFPRGDRFIGLMQTDPISGEIMGVPLTLNGFAFEQLAENTNAFLSLGVARDISATVSDGETVEVYLASEITPDLLALTSVQPILGRLLSVFDSAPDTEPVSLISFRLWQNYYASDRDIIGRQMKMNGNPYVIVGVLPEGLSSP